MYEYKYIYKDFANTAPYELFNKPVELEFNANVQKVARFKPRTLGFVSNCCTTN
jgi:hypothetical protein